MKPKKLLVCLGVLSAIFFLAGCGKDPVEIDYDEFVATPTNLSISRADNELTWSPVENATGYVVYIDGEAESTETVTSFDFTSYIGDDVIVFRISALAPIGMKDSGQSVSIAYNPNPAEERAAIMSVLSNNGYGDWGTDDFIDALITKGVTAEDLLAFINAYKQYEDDVESASGDPVGIMDAFEEFMSHVENIEAFVSALMSTKLMIIIQDEIDASQEQLDFYMSLSEEIRDLFYAEEIENLENNIIAMENAMLAIQDSFDYTVLSVTGSIEYLMTVFTDMDTVLTSVTDIYQEGISGFEDFNPDEFIVIKDELVGVLRDNEPSMSDCVLLFETINAIGEVFSGINLQSDDFASITVTQYAAKMVIGYQIAIEYIDSYDLDFFTTFKDLGLTYAEDQPAMLEAEIEILYLKHVKAFKDDNQNLFDQYDEVFTPEEKQSIFGFYVSYLMEASNILQAFSGYTEYENEISSFLENLQNVGYETMDTISDMSEQCYDKMMNYFVKTDGEILRLMAIADQFYVTYPDHVYVFGNYALDITYKSADELYMAILENQIKIIDHILGYLDAMTGEISDDDIPALVDLIQTTIPYDSIAAIFDMDEGAMIKFETDIDTLLTEQLPNVVELLDNLGGYEKFYNVIGRLANRISGWDDYFANDTEDYVLIIYLLDYYGSFMNSGNQDLVNEIKTGIFKTMKEPEIIDMLSSYVYGLDEGDINELENNFDLAFAFSLSEADVISRLDKNNLTVADKARIDRYFDTIKDYFIS